MTASLLRSEKYLLKQYASRTDLKSTKIEGSILKTILPQNFDTYLCHLHIKPIK